jgi:hypothetical protein
MIDVDQTQLGNKIIEDLSGQSLGEKISQLRLSGNRKQFENALLNFISDKMTVNFEVFGSLMEYRIRSYVNSTLIVTV